jgi:hypothetical protein
MQVHDQVEPPLLHGARGQVRLPRLLTLSVGHAQPNFGGLHNSRIRPEPSHNLAVGHPGQRVGVSQVSEAFVPMLASFSIEPVARRDTFYRNMKEHVYIAFSLVLRRRRRGAHMDLFSFRRHSAVGQQSTAACLKWLLILLPRTWATLFLGPPTKGPGA